MEYTREYQAHLIARMLNPEFLKQTARFLKAEYFDEDLFDTVSLVLKTFNKFGKPPTKVQLRQMMKGKSLPFAEGSPMEIDVTEVTNFAKHREFRDSMLTGLRMIADGHYDDAFSIVSGHLRKSSIGDIDDVFDLFDGETDPGREGGITSGILGFDDDNAGICRGEAASIMASSNGGKSSFLVHIGARAAEHGINVFHASLEMPKSAMRRKYFDRLGDVAPPKTKGRKGSKQTSKKSQLGRIHVYCAMPGAARLFDIRQRIENLDWKPDLVIVDSLDNVRPTRFMDSERWNQEEAIAQDFKAMVMELDIVGYTSFQANRPGYGRDVIKMEHVKGSLDKIRLMDHVCSINQDDEEIIVDKETGECSARLFNSKNRYGPRGGIYKMRVNFSKCHFEDLNKYV